MTSSAAHTAAKIMEYKPRDHCDFRSDALGGDMARRTSWFSLVAALACPWAAASTQIVDLSALSSTTTLAAPFAGNESLLVNTLVPSAAGALTNSVFFTVGTGVTSFTGAAAWAIGSAAGLDPRLIGVNIDIFDASNALVASDSGVTVANGFAVSALGAAIGPGTYRLVMTGTGVRASSLDVSLTFSGTPSGSPPIPMGTPLLQSSTLAAPLSAGNTIFIDSTAAGQTGPLRQQLTFTAGAGVTGFTSQAAWEVSSAAAFDPRLVGVNVDLFDAANNLLFSDGGVILANGFALSSFSGGLAPGTYTLVATGTAVRDVFLDVSLTLTGAQVAAIPEPETYALLLAGLGLIAGVARRR
ncbi:MAG: FxDxF family PEP-CTERM protein, partial [Myxococcales bacterium]|nr:FxDxF family PEP-CTERM protein [Myxococcales bacterium]